MTFFGILDSSSYNPQSPLTRVQLSFAASVLGKARTFNPKSGRNSHYKYHPSSFRISHSELWQFKRKATLELQ
ncbi:hypothetical protein MTR_8g447060 [Medicago truncatula]|uniref:Uncharacterized protein n=1 Tax=Medicago truncatula TaxID=3880 RepID=A0A072TPA3_MEDTR|nr:hypothetical protein MTR_8g447060 [Medicago truncatula]